MTDRNWRMPSLSRDLAIIGGGLLVGAFTLGAGTAALIVRRRGR